MPFDPLSDADIVRKRLLAEQDQAIDDAHLPPTPEEGDPVPAADPAQPSTPPIPITQEVKEPPADWQTALVAKHYPELTPLSLQTSKPPALDNAVDVSGPAQEPDDGSDVLAPLPPARGKKPPAQLAKPPASALPGPGMGDVKEGDEPGADLSSSPHSANLTAPEPDTGAPSIAGNPDRAASLEPGAEQAPEPAPAPGPAPAPAPGPAPIPSRQSFASPAVSDGSHDKMLEALYHAGTRTALPDSFFQPKASQDPELLALKKMLLEKNIMAPPKGGQQTKPQDDATSPRSLIAQHFTIQTRPDVVKLAGGGDPEKGEKALREMSETQIIALVKQADAGTKIGQGSERIEQTDEMLKLRKARETAVEIRAQRNYDMSYARMAKAFGDKIPPEALTVTRLGAQFDSLIDEMATQAGGYEKVAGLGFIESAFPDSIMGSKVIQLRKAAKDINVMAIKQQFGSRFTETDEKLWAEAYAQIRGGNTVDQVLTGLHNMRQIIADKTEQALMMAPEDIKKKAHDEFTRPPGSIVPQPPPLRGQPGGGEPLQEHPAVQKLRGLIGDISDALGVQSGADIVNKGLQAIKPAAPNQSTGQPAPTPAPKEGDTAQLNGKTYVVKNGKWHERGE